MNYEIINNFNKVVINNKINFKIHNNFNLIVMLNFLKKIIHNLHHPFNIQKIIDNKLKNI